jgi:hypothetical protein
MDTLYVSYLAYQHSDLLGTSVATELLLGLFLFYKVRTQEVPPSLEQGGKDQETARK